MKDFTLSSPQEPNKLRIDYEKELNAEQLEVVQNGDGPTLVLAGAGSGKTRAITYRVAWLLEHGVAPSNILLLTFTNKAAKEMTHRVEALFGIYPQGLWSGTFHSVANKLLRQYAPLVGFAPNFSILDTDDSKDLVGICVKELKIDTKARRFPSASVLHSLLSFRANKNCSIESAVQEKHPNFLPLLSEIEEVARLYPLYKRQQNAMDFDDLLLKLLELLREHPDVAEHLADQFQYILVDEFQDTNVIQAEIVHRLAKKHQNILVVGDDAQSIYSFRAADIQNILSFPKQYEKAKTYKLVTNYRSTPEILSVANKVIEQNTEQFHKELRAVCQTGELPCVVPAQNVNQEAQYIVDQLLEFHAEGTPLREIAILFRAAFHSQALEFELMKRDIPYEYRGGMKFFERAHIKDAVAHLRITHNVKDGMAWIRALKIHPGLGVVTATKITRQCAELEDIAHAKDVTINGKKAGSGWLGFVRILKDLLNVRRVPSELIRAFAANDDYHLYLENEYPNYRERLDDLEQFAIFAEQFQDIGQFLEAVSLTDEYTAVRERGAVEDTDKIILSTIHQAKGLEWDHVFVINLVEGGFPHSRSYEERNGLEEERRLFYVAITRARKNLFLTYPMTAGYETLELKQPSTFLEEIPKKSIETVRLRQPRTFASRGSSFYGGNSDYEEPSIVLDDLGERVAKPMPASFLRDIDEL